MNDPAMPMPEPAPSPSAEHASHGDSAEPTSEASDYSDAGSSNDPASDALADDFSMTHVFENGRRYADRNCFFPNDDTETTRLAITHQLHLILLNGELTESRVLPGPVRILDVGTGPGDWAIAMGEAYPRATVIATDITMYQPVKTPPNVEFRIEDASLEWIYEEPFDLIHMRDMISALPDFEHVYRQVARYLKSSGTFEFATAGPVLLKHNYEESALKEWNDFFREALATAGVKYWLDYRNQAALEQAGLRTLKHKHREVRIGEWTSDEHERRLGRMALVAAAEGIEAASLRALTKYLGWTSAEVQAICERVRAELMDLTNEAYVEVSYIVAKRLPGVD